MAKAKLTSSDKYRNQTYGECDQYVDVVGNGGDYETVEDWCDEMCIDMKDVEDMLLNANGDHWTDISAYC